VLLDCGEGTRAELRRRVGPEEMRPAVHRVHRLAAGRIARKELGDADIRLVERLDERVESVFGNRGVGHDRGV
jgi:hypothetical protein